MAVAEAAADRVVASPPSQQQGAVGRRPYTFFSVFKWEWRKGWDVLLLSYWKAFQEVSHDGGTGVLLRAKGASAPQGIEPWTSPLCDPSLTN